MENMLFADPFLHFIRFMYDNLLITSISEREEKQYANRNCKVVQ
jgi:hypothetical protein